MYRTLTYATTRNALLGVPTSPLQDCWAVGTSGPGSSDDLPAGPAGGDDLVLRRPGARRRIQPRLPPPAAKLLAAL